MRREFLKAHQVRAKGPRDIVTDVDHAAQETIVRWLRRHFPEHLILAEEGADPCEPTAPEAVWIVDPLDGTTNYTRRIPLFGVAIALAEGGRLRLGVVHNPMAGHTFYAEAGRGAFLVREAGGRRSKPERLRVSGADSLGEAVVAVDWAHGDEYRAQTLAALREVIPASRTMRNFGSAALGHVYVAAGWVDAFFHFELKPWDVAAPAIIVLEAGGQLTTPEGAAWALPGSQVVASNGHIHAELLAIIKEGK